MADWVYVLTYFYSQFLFSVDWLISPSPSPLSFSLISKKQNFKTYRRDRKNRNGKKDRRDKKNSRNRKDRKG